MVEAGQGAGEGEGEALGAAQEGLQRGVDGGLVQEVGAGGSGKHEGREALDLRRSALELEDPLPDGKETLHLQGNKLREPPQEQQ